LLKVEVFTVNEERLRTIPGVIPSAVFSLIVTERRDKEEDKREITPELVAELEVNEDVETVETGEVDPKMKIAEPLSAQEFESKVLSLT
jgi:hypothetical protein